MGSSRIFISLLHDPFSNLAIENALLSRICAPSLFLYQNSVCVVIGRAQNPWIETDVAFLEQHHIPLLRRQSGGGTVVHDLGNLNFSFLSPKAEFDKTQNILLVQKALASIGTEVEIGERQDLLFNGKKVSGSAFRETKDNCFHHGTLLIHSDLDLLRRCLQVPPHQISSKSIPSRRSSVTNLGVSIETVKTALIQTFAAPEKVCEIDTATALNLDIDSTQTLYRSEDWIYNRTLDFTDRIDLETQAVALCVEAGLITHIEPMPPQLEKFLAQPYRFYRNRDAAQE